MKFIDLFAGLGGFHLALAELGHECVFASEIDEGLQALYESNFGLKPAGDIKSVSLADIPNHDIVCAGFPCQPFSKAGDQQGFECPKWGNLFDHVLVVLRQHKPRYVILENVPNLARHGNGETYKRMESDLRAVGYDVRHEPLSPHQFGIPQIRERIFIVGDRNGLDRFEWPRKPDKPKLDLASVLDTNPVDARSLSEQVLGCLDAWQTFLDLAPKDRELPSFPIWSMEFGATYPYERATPHVLGAEKLREFLGNHGTPLSDVAAEALFDHLPSYARTQEDRFPKWKIEFIRQNRQFYEDNKDWIEPWKPSILAFPASLQKLEWNCKGDKRSIWDHVIQFRASGVRVKRPTTAPSLIAMTSTQVPIVGWEKRYMTPRECARLQSMESLKHLPESPTPAFRALGNAVNVQIVRMVAGALLMTEVKHAAAPEEVLINA